MNKFIKKGIAGLFTFLASTQSVLANCTLNGKEIPCGEMPTWFFVLPFVFLAIGIACFIFWLLMLLDAIKHEKEDKIMWVLLIVLLNFLGALIYYFARKKKRVNPA